MTPTRRLSGAESSGRLRRNMYAREWIQPSTTRRVAKRLAVTGSDTVTEQLIGYEQIRKLDAVACTHDDAVTLLRDMEGSEYHHEVEHSFQEALHLGVHLFTVSVTGKRFPSAPNAGQYNPSYQGAT